MDVPSSIWKYMPSLICGCALFYIWMYPLPYKEVKHIHIWMCPTSIYGCSFFHIRICSSFKYECVHLPYMDVPCPIICICLSTIYGCNFIGTCMLCMLNTADNPPPPLPPGPESCHNQQLCKLGRYTLTYYFQMVLHCF